MIARCDFCAGATPAWGFGCDDFETPAHTGEGLLIHRSIGGWAACPACKALVEADDVEGLVARALIVGPAACLPAAVVNTLVRPSLSDLFRRVLPKLAHPPVPVAMVEVDPPVLSPATPGDIARVVGGPALGDPGAN